MIETAKKSDHTKTDQKSLPQQELIRQQILQNLHKQSALSHGHIISPISEKNNKSQNQLNSSYPNSSRYSNGFKIQSARKQVEELKIEDNEFMNEEQMNQKIILNGYFSQLVKQIVRKKTQCVAKQYSDKIQKSLESQINHGVIKIASYQEDIKNLLNQFKLSSDELKILEKRTQTQIRQQKINLLDPFHQMRKDKYSMKQVQKNSLEKTILNNYVTSAVLSKQEHKKLIEKFNLSHKQNQQKKRQRIFEIQERQRSLSNEKSIAQAERIKKQKQFRRLSIEQKLLKRKKNHENFILQEKISTQKYIEMKKKKLLHEKMKEKYKSQILIPSLEEKKMKLKEIRDFNKKYDLEEIKKHEQEYLEKKSEQSNKHNSRHKIMTFDYNPPTRSKKLEELLQEERFKAKIKFQEKKRVAEENKIKQINFLSDIKLKYKPKIDKVKRQEIQKRLKSQEAKNQKSVERDLKLLGMKHFEEARKFIKKPKNKQKTQGEEIKQYQGKTQRANVRTKQKTEGNDFLQKQDQQNEFLKVKMGRKSSMTRPDKRINMSFSQNSNHKINLHEQKRKEIKKIINSNDLERSVKLERLKIQNERVSQIYKRKEKFFRQNEDDIKNRQQAVELLLNSIQAKMGIIDLCTKA